MKNVVKMALSLCACFLLCFGCTAAPSHVEESATVPSPESGAATAAKQPLPWAEEPVAEPLDYNDYFAEIKDYHTASLLYDWEDVGDAPTEPLIGCDIPFGIRYHAPDLILWDSKNALGEISIVWQHPLDFGEDFVLTAWDTQYIYGVRDGKDLIRSDYYGEEVQVLFSDPSDAWKNGIRTVEDFVFPGKHTNELQQQFYLADQCVLFFLAGSSQQQGLSIYRLYLPDATIDELVNGLPDDTQLKLPVSNQEIVWSEPNPDYEETFSKVRNDPDNPFLPELDDADAWQPYEATYRIPASSEHYYHAVTKEHRTTQGWNNSPFVTRTSTPEEMAANGPRWWKDSI